MAGGAAVTIRETGQRLPAPHDAHATVLLRRWRLQQQAREWIFESNYERPFSFPGLCEALGLDASYLRERLARSQGIHLARRPPVVARHGGPFR